MNGWLVVGALAVIAVLIVIAVTARRARTAEELLATPGDRGQAPSPSAVPPSSPQPLKNLILSLVAKHATGLLTAKHAGDTCSISMLFGHIYDASTGTLDGEPALRRALSWPSPLCQFDATAKLTTNETITTPTRSLLESLEEDPPPPPA